MLRIGRINLLDKLRRKSEEKRSPLKAPPLRHAGQSLDEEIQKILNDKISECAAWLAMLFGFASFEWFRWYFKLPPQPVALTIFASCGGGYAYIRIRQYRRQLKNLRQARDGEKAVGQYLEDLREKGYRIFHDVIGKDFNIDHVLIGRAGAFTIETKTISKPSRGQAQIQYDGEKITIGGFSPDRDPVIQAKAQAHWLQEFIKESTGRILTVRPVVLYPGWYITKQPKGVQVWVLEPKSLPSFLEHENSVLSLEDTQLVAYHLSHYIRESCKNDKGKK